MSRKRLLFNNTRELLFDGSLEDLLASGGETRPRLTLDEWMDRDIRFIYFFSEDKNLDLSPLLAAARERDIELKRYPLEKFEERDSDYLLRKFFQGVSF